MLALAACMAGGQQKSADQTEQPVPKRFCQYVKYAPWRQVKADPPIEDLTRFDMSVLTGDRVIFHKGTVVTLNRREGSWSCVSGNFNDSSKGWQFRTGWMKSDLLGPVEEQEPSAGTDRR